MGLFKRKENRASGEVEFEDSLLNAILNNGSVTKDKALAIPTISGGIDLIANVVASTPIKIYREFDGKAKEQNKDYRVKLLNDETGDTLNANEFWHAMIRDYYLGKGGYAFINRSKGKFASIHYVDEAQISFEYNTDPIFKDYKILVMGNKYEPYDFVRILRNTKDGRQGVPITKENALGIEVAYETLNYERNLVKKGGNKKGFLVATKRLTQEAIDSLKRTYKNLYANSGENLMVLNEGLDFKESSNTSVEMQLVENKKAFADDFARLFHIAPELMAGISGDTTALAKLAAIPLMKVIECALNQSFLTEAEKSNNYYWAFDTKELLKGDIKARFDAYKTALDGNFMQIDEVRFAEDLEPLGLNWIKLGLNDVLYNPKTKEVYTPNTNQTQKLNQ